MLTSNQCASNSHCNVCVSPYFLRKQCWARKCCRTAGGGSSSRGVGRRASSRPQESPRRQIQPHPGLKSSSFIPLTSSHLWALFVLLPQPFVCPRESYQMWDAPHPQVHCFDTSFWKTVLYCFYCLIFDGSTLCICIHAVQTRPLLSHRPERVQGSRSSLPASKLSPGFIPAALAEAEGTSSFQKTNKSRTSLPSHTHLCFQVYLLK